MYEAFLIGTFSIFFLVTFIYIVSKDIFFGGVYFFLFLYTIFAQIGYVYFPQLSILIKAYFEIEIYYVYYYFVFASFILFFLLFFFLYKPLIKKYNYHVKESKPKLRIFNTILFFFYFYMLGYFIANYNNISYENAVDTDLTKQLGAAYFIFFTGFKNLTLLCLTLYAKIRLQGNNQQAQKKVINYVIFLLFFLLFVSISTKLGSRTDIVAFLIGALFFEAANISQISIKRKIAILFVVIFAGIFLNSLEHNRSENSQRDSLEGVEKLMMKDYYAPSHLLYGMIYHNYIYPGKVIESNLANLLVKMNVPYLSQDIGNLINPGSSDRGKSYAFYIFNEGYMFMGKWGFIYNGLVVFFGLVIVRRLARSNHILYNNFILALISTQMANFTRSQSMYFIKDIYFIFLPWMIMLYLGTGLRPYIRRKIAK